VLAGPSGAVHGLVVDGGGDLLAAGWGLLAFHDTRVLSGRLVIL